VLGGITVWRTVKVRIGASVVAALLVRRFTPPPLLLLLLLP